MNSPEFADLQTLSGELAPWANPPYVARARRASRSSSTASKTERERINEIGKKGLPSSATRVWAK